MFIYILLSNTTVSKKSLLYKEAPHTKNVNIPLTHYSLIGKTLITFEYKVIVPTINGLM